MVQPLLGNARGTASLEMVVVMPVLLFVLFGVTELSRAWLTVNLAATAAREAARLASVAAPEEFPSPPAAVQRTRELLGDAASATFTCLPSPCTSGGTVRVTVQTTFATALPVLLPMLHALPIQQVVSMRYE